jgi:hypothetical protein
MAGEGRAGSYLERARRAYPDDGGDGQVWETGEEVGQGVLRGEWGAPGE